MKFRDQLSLGVLLCAAASPVPAWSQQTSQPMPGMPMGSTPGKQMDSVPGMKMDSMSGMQKDSMPDTKKDSMPDMQKHSMPGMQMDSMPGMTMGPMQGGQPPANARAPDYSEGTQRSHLGGMEMADDMLFGRILVDRLEWSRDRHATSARTESEAWYGGDIDKVWFKLDAERRGGRLDSARTELLWNRNVAAFWSTQLGARHDTGGGPARDWLAAGIQGLAPYRFETEATAYVGRAGSLAARFNVKYELLFTPRLILEPELAANMYSRADRERGLGAGLSDTSAALTLRYEVTRQFAPYLGLEWTRRFHQTADLAQSEGRQTSATALRFGVRLWY